MYLPNFTQQSCKWKDKCRFFLQNWVGLCSLLPLANKVNANDERTSKYYNDMSLCKVYFQTFLVTGIGNMTDRPVAQALLLRGQVFASW